MGTDITENTVNTSMHTFINVQKMSSFFTYHETMKLTEKYFEYNICSSLRYKIHSKYFSLRYTKSYAEVHACINVKCPILSSVLTKSK
jgi:phosphate starvation-inducible membrane PsiE